MVIVVRSRCQVAKGGNKSCEEYGWIDWWIGHITTNVFYPTG